jgi:hypothetical protein
VFYQHGSQFWRGLHEIKYTCQKGLKYVVGNGRKVRFWEDVWLGECPLKLRFNRLCKISREQKWVVAKVLERGEINLSFRRRLGELEIKEWEELEECLSWVHLSDEEDIVKWALTKNGLFSMTSLYKHCVFSGVVDVRMEELWNSKIPLKVKNFVWLVYQDRVQTADNLIKKKWKGDSRCSLCLGVESVDHLIFICPLAGFVWSVVKEGVGWGRTPKSVKEFNDEFLFERGHKDNGRVFFLVWGGVLDSLIK